MKSIGILLIGLLTGLFAATVNLSSGGSLWTALLAYVGFGMITTLLAVIFVIWRAWETERPNAKLVLRGAP